PPDRQGEDDVHVDDYTNNNIYVGPVAPCDVAAEPGMLLDDGATAVAELPRPVYLPAGRVGSSRSYEAAIPDIAGSQVTEGMLPPGLALDNGSVVGDLLPEAASGSEVVLYRFGVMGSSGPLDVRLAVYPEQWTAADELPEYWKRGPYPTWNTEPVEGEASNCPQNPLMPELQGDSDIELFISYPAESEPTVTGSGNVAPGRWPVIVYAHANNDWACDINERYRSLHDHWASWGYVVVAVDMTELNCQLGYPENFEQRTERQIAAVETLEALDNDPNSRFYGRLDLSKLVMAGHSRGGFSSIRSLYSFDKTQAVITLQGVSIMAWGLGVDPVPAVPVLGMTAELDRDLEYPSVETTEDRLTGPYTWVDITGGIHAYTADTAPIEADDEPKISQQRQHDITEWYTTAFLARHIGVGDGQMPSTITPDLRAEAIVHGPQGARQVFESISPLGVQARWSRHRQSTWVDDFNSAFEGDPLFVNDLGGENLGQALASWEEVPTYAPDEPDADIFFLRSVSMRLVAPETGNGRFRMELSPDGEMASVEVGPGQSLQARIKGPDEGPMATFTVEIEGESGTARVSGADGVGASALSNRFTQLEIPLGPLGVGTTLRAVTFEVEGGTLFVDDVRIE
ncbi:MAG: hypothetical protein AAFS10_01455, partial [Myxococcota bacterium]